MSKSGSRRTCVRLGKHACLLHARGLRGALARQVLEHSASAVSACHGAPPRQLAVCSYTPSLPRRLHAGCRAAQVMQHVSATPCLTAACSWLRRNVQNASPGSCAGLRASRAACAKVLPRRYVALGCPCKGRAAQPGMRCFGLGALACCLAEKHCIQDCRGEPVFFFGNPRSGATQQMVHRAAPDLQLARAKAAQKLKHNQAKRFLQCAACLLCHPEAAPYQ